jgi:hypothetical protein
MMDIDGLIVFLESTSLDTATTLEHQIQLVATVLSRFEEFNRANEATFHFTGQKDQRLGTQLAGVLKRAVGYLDRVERSEAREEYRLTEVYYELCSSCLNTIRILSRDTDVIGALQVDELLGLIQQMADLKDLVETTEIMRDQVK